MLVNLVKLLEQRYQPEQLVELTNVRMGHPLFFLHPTKITYIRLGLPNFYCLSRSSDQHASSPFFQHCSISPFFQHCSRSLIGLLLQNWIRPSKQGLCTGLFTHFWYMLHLSSFTAVNGNCWGCCAQVSFTYFWYMLHLSSFTTLNGNCWGCCAQVNWHFSCICCTSFPSPQWTEIVEAAVFMFISLILVYDAPLFFHHIERKLMRLLCSS